MVLFGRKVFSRLKIPFECFLFLFGQKVIRPPLSRDFGLKKGQNLSALLFRKNSLSWSPSLVVFGKKRFYMVKYA